MIDRKQNCYFISPTVPYSDTVVISNNVIVALGHVAVALKDSPRTTETILHQCLLQRFCRPPSSLDTLIVDQMGCMLLAKNEVRILYYQWWAFR